MFNCRAGLLLFANLLSFLYVTAQIPPKDSLTTIINSSQPDSVKVVTLLKLGKIYLAEQDSAKTADNFFKALNLAKASGFNKGVIKSIIQIGYLNELTQNYDKALHYYTEAVQYGTKHNIVYDLALAHSYKFFIYSTRSNYKAAIASGDSAYYYFKKLNRPMDMANQLNNVGLMHNKLNRNKEAIVYYQKALTLYNGLGKDADKQRVGTILNIGMIFEAMKAHDQALKYYNEAYNIAQKNNFTPTILKATNNIGNIYFNTKNYKKAYDYYYRNLELSKKTENAVDKGISFGNVANALTYLKDYKNAEKYYQLAFQQNKISGNVENVVSSYINYAGMLSFMGQLKLADTYLQKAMALADKNDMPIHKHNIFESMAEIKKLEKDYQKAYALQDSAYQLKDANLNTNTNNEVARLQIQYQTEKKEKELAENKTRLALNKLELQKKSSMLYLAALGVILLCGVVFYIITASRARQKRMQAQNAFNLQLAGAEARNQMQEEKLRISRELHDNIGAQLTFINTSIQNVNEHHADVSLLAETQKITQNTIADLRRTVWLINKQEVELDDLVIKLRDYIKPLQAGNPQFRIVVTSEGDCLLPPLAATHLFRIVQEGLNNALKYANASLMEVNIHCTSGKLKLIITDNGVGFDQQTVDGGYGLKNIKARAEALNGICGITSEPGKGSKISVEFPV